MSQKCLVIPWLAFGVMTMLGQQLGAEGGEGEDLVKWGISKYKKGGAQPLLR